MANICILGTGPGGIPMALEIRQQARPDDQVTVINKTGIYPFVPPNPWVAAGRRKPADIEVALAPVFKKRGIHIASATAEKVLPEENRVRLVETS